MHAGKLNTSKQWTSEAVLTPRHPKRRVLDPRAEIIDTANRQSIVSTSHQDEDVVSSSPTEPSPATVGK